MINEDKNMNDNSMEVPNIINLDDDFFLIKKFNEGDESTFRNLVHKHKDKVRNLVFITMGNVEQVDDISQDVFITVYRNLKNFRFESQFTTWLYRITINKCKDQLRKAKIRSIFTSIKDDEEEHVVYDKNNEPDDTSAIVQNAIAQLPDKLRIPLLLKDIEGMSYQEIAEATNSEIGTVKSRIFRAREGLKKILKPFEKELMS